MFKYSLQPLDQRAKKQRALIHPTDSAKIEEKTSSLVIVDSVTVPRWRCLL